MPERASEVQERLAAACRRRHGPSAQIANLKPLSAGASAETWRFDLERGTESLPLVAQLFTGEQQFAAALDKRTQGLVQQAAHRAGIATPRIDFILDETDGLGEGFVAAFVPGETLGQRIVRDDRYTEARDRMTGQCARLLARIHAVDVAALPPLPCDPPADMVEKLAEIHDRYGVRIPVFDLAFQWLRDADVGEQPPRLVHGDFRNGNFIVDESGLVCVLDWEAAHLGDPMEDLGWLCMNAWRFGRIELPVGGFGRRDALYAAYEEAARVPVDPVRVRFWEVFGTLKWGVICQWFSHQFLSGEVPRLERAAIGRRVAEVELDLLDLLEGVEPCR